MTSGWRDTLQQGLGSQYRIRQELGGGGMSATFIVEETALGRTVVLKALPPELAAGINTERFEREIHLAARLQHAFVVPLLSAGTNGGVPWYTMPLVQGESLRVRIAREGALTHTAATRILRDVAEALAYAHSQGVVHRDIKPDNILLSGAHALVTDFGVAKAVSASTGGDGMTGVGMALGTVSYMAPEQAAGDPATDHRADLYSLGATAYEMLSGRQLFAGRAPAQVLIAHATEKPEPLGDVAPGLPRELCALVEQLLAKHPNDRPSHAQQVADSLGAMLTRWTSGELLPARAMTLGRALSLWSAAFVGVVGAAWLAMRLLPVPNWTLSAAMLVMLAGLPVLAVTAWLHRPARPIAPVPSVSSTTAVGRLQAIARPHFTWRRAAYGGAVAVGALVLLAGAWAGSRTLGIGPAASLRAQGRLGPADRVFIADFDAPANDTGLGPVVTDLLRTEVGRSESIPLVSPNERTATLAAMGLAPSARVDRALAREFSQRAGAKAFLTGSVNAVGDAYVVRSTLAATESGEVLAEFRENARSSDDIIDAVDRVGRSVRDRLGASLQEIRAAPPLFWSVTPSLLAARLYTEGVTKAEGGDQTAALPILERAVQVDTQFAMAYRRLASYYANLGNPERAVWAVARSFRLREKLPPVEQRLVEGTYYWREVADFDMDKSIAAWEAALELDPRHGVALNNLAVALRWRRDFERALQTLRTALQYDTTSTFAPVGILPVMWATGRKDEARQHVANNLTRWLPGTAALVVATARLASAGLAVDSAAAIIEAGLREELRGGAGVRAGLHFSLARMQRAQGRLRLAEQSVAQWRTLNPAADTVARIPPSVVNRALVLAWDRERPAEAKALLDSIVAAHPPNDAGPLAYRWLELAQTYALAGDPARARALVTTYEQRSSDGQKRAAQQPLNVTRGHIAVAEKRYAEAISAYRNADVGECTICALAPLAHAYDLAGNADSAIAVLERYLAANYYPRANVDDMYLAASYKRLGELYDARGEAEKAASYYARFVDLWKNADPEQQPKVRAVRARLAQLSGKEKG